MSDLKPTVQKPGQPKRDPSYRATAKKSQATERPKMPPPTISDLKVFRARTEKAKNMTDEQVRAAIVKERSEKLVDKRGVGLGKK